MRFMELVLFYVDNQSLVTFSFSFFALSNLPSEAPFIILYLFLLHFIDGPFKGQASLCLISLCK